MSEPLCYIYLFEWRCYIFCYVALKSFDNRAYLNHSVLKLHLYDPGKIYSRLA